MKVSFDARSIEVTPSSSGKYTVTSDDKTILVEVFQVQDGKLDLLFDSQRVTAYVSSDGAKRWITINGQTSVLTKSSTGTRRAQHGHHAQDELTAPMPGQVSAVNVSEGDYVTKGQTLLMLEAMKMEIRVAALRDGVVMKLFVQQGQTVERGQILVEIVDTLAS